MLVDTAGGVLWANMTAAHFFGQTREELTGRDFFRGVAPGAYVPAFHGRFIDCVQGRAPGAAFDFTFGLDPPVRTRVTLRASARSDHHWIMVEPLAVLPPTRQRRASEDASAAQDAVDRRSRAEPVDPGVCEREPIHVPGAVQPHAVLLAFDPATLTAATCSDNVADALGMEPTAVLGRGLADLLPASPAADLAQALASGALASPDRPWLGQARLGPEERPFALTAHLNAGRLLLELEMLPAPPHAFGAASAADAQRAVRRVRAAMTLEEAAAACAEDLRAMTGFQRVLVYRFDAEWNGEAVAEARDQGYQSLLGLRFPASDIPAQARALYTRAPARFVVDRDAPPAPLMAAPAAADRPVDLTHAYSRALSPIHLEYQRNLDVNGSMSVSIIVGDALWGLVIGHHRRPHYVTPDTRSLAALVTDAFALRVQELATVRAWRDQQNGLQVRGALLRRLAGADDFVAALTGSGADGITVLDLFSCTGAAVVTDGRVAVAGRTPPPDAVLALARWLRADLPPQARSFATADLSEHWPAGAEWRDRASGLLAALVDADRNHLLLWFRPEVASTVSWGGDPTKPVLADAATRTVLPRRSFERWVEERRGRAEDWAPWQRAAAEGLADAIEGVVLRQGRKIGELSAKQRELTRALEQREVLAREIDHRVKNSLQIVAGVMLMQARGVSDPAAKAAFQEAHARVMSVARVHDSLQHAGDAETVDLGQTMRLLCGDLAAGLAGDAGRLALDAQPGLMVPSRTAVALSLIATELVTNAFKYAYPPDRPGPVEVRVAAREPAGLELSVRDRGRGLPPDWDTRPRGSGGLGMRVIRAMLAQVSAEMAVEPDLRPGTCFRVRA